ncbi:MAG: hypothetical protein ACTSUE_06525 [Promethearchaeota archaeon]
MNQDEDESNKWNRPKEQDKKDRIEQLKNIEKMKIHRLEQITKDYVEILLQDENEIEIDVLRYLLLDLLPLAEVHEDVDELIELAIKEKKLPWKLDGEVYKRTGKPVEKPSWEDIEKEENFLKETGDVLGNIFKTKRQLSFHVIEKEFDQAGIVPPKGETIISLLERVIKKGFFKGHIDMVESVVVRGKSEGELYQERFLKELDQFKQKEVNDDAEEIIARTRKIPRDLESLLLAPDKPREIDGILETFDDEAQLIEKFITQSMHEHDSIKMVELHGKIKEYILTQHLTIPAVSISEEEVESILERLLHSGKIKGYFEKDSFVYKGN